MMDIYEFGKFLITEHDLDPDYIAIYHGFQDQPREQLYQYLLSFWCFCHLGTAGWCTDGPYWQRMHQAAVTSSIKRGKHRRHYRGQLALKSIDYLQAISIDKLFSTLLQYGTVQGICAYASTWYGFSTWSAFKVADMVDRMGLRSVLFDKSSCLYESPLKGARLFAKLAGVQVSSPGDWAMDVLVNHLAPLGSIAPHNHRTIGPAEVETILCKWRSHIRGHYTPGEDLNICKDELSQPPEPSPTCQRLLQAGADFGLYQR